MTLLYTSPRMLDHDTGKHPERADRLRQVVRHLERTELDTQCQRPAWEPASVEALLRCHSAEHLAALEKFAAAGGGQVEADTVMSPASFDVARLAAGAGVDAVTRVLAGEARNALCLIRPPGHHALADAPMGFCLFNNIAVAARAALAAGVSRVLIVDWDVHHGNGTQDLFYDDPRVGFFSLHRWPFYPGTGDRNETGTGDGLGATHNIPVMHGTPFKQILAQFTSELTDFAARMRPELVLLSAGFDAHRDDPVGDLGLETEDFIPLTETTLAIANEYAGGKLVSLLEGGYNPGVLAGCVEEHLKVLLKD
jgi:acetoin utilization deacetylase AcuC-like enzyme